MPSTTVTLEVMGLAREVLVDFTINSFGTADSYYEPGDPPEIEINDVEDHDGPGQYAKYESFRDLELKTFRSFPNRKVWYDEEGAHVELGEAVVALAYGYGFHIIHHPAVTNAYTGVRHPPYVKTTFNSDRTLLDVIMDDILERLNDFDTQDYD